MRQGRVGLDIFQYTSYLLVVAIVVVVVVLLAFLNQIDT